MGASNLRTQVLLSPCLVLEWFIYVLWYVWNHVLEIWRYFMNRFTCNKYFRPIYSLIVLLQDFTSMLCFCGLCCGWLTYSYSWICSMSDELGLDIFSRIDCDVLYFVIIIFHKKNGNAIRFSHHPSESYSIPWNFDIIIWFQNHSKFWQSMWCL